MGGKAPNGAVQRIGGAVVVIRNYAPVIGPQVVQRGCAVVAELDSQVGAGFDVFLRVFRPEAEPVAGGRAAGGGGVPGEGGLDGNRVIAFGGGNQDGRVRHQQRNGKFPFIGADVRRGARSRVACLAGAEVFIKVRTDTGDGDAVAFRLGLGSGGDMQVGRAYEGNFLSEAVMVEGSGRRFVIVQGLVAGRGRPADQVLRSRGAGVVDVPVRGGIDVGKAVRGLPEGHALTAVSRRAGIHEDIVVHQD